VQRSGLPRLQESFFLETSPWCLRCSRTLVSRRFISFRSGSLAKNCGRPERRKHYDPMESPVRNTDGGSRSKPLLFNLGWNGEAVSRLYGPFLGAQLAIGLGHQNAKFEETQGVLKIHLPLPNPQWKSLTSMHFQGTYAMHASAFTVAQRADFVKEANRICLLLLRKLREMTTDPSDFTWVLLPETLAAATNVSSSVEVPTWHVGVQALLKSGDEASESLWNAWAPLLDSALRFAMPIESAGTYDISDGDPNNHVTFHMTL